MMKILSDLTEEIACKKQMDIVRRRMGRLRKIQKYTLKIKNANRSEEYL